MNKPFASRTEIAGSDARSTAAVQMIAGMCVAEVLSMAGVFTFPALLPRFQELWHLSHTQAGWVNGIFFAGYTLAVPVLAGLTDRQDARRIYRLSALLSASAALGFCLLAQGLASALLFRFLGGMGLAGTFIPGLKALVDRLEGRFQARAIAIYTATFSIGSSLSFFSAGYLASRFGWQAAFASAAGLVGLAVLISSWVLDPLPQAAGQQGRTVRLLDFRPVFRNRPAMAYILAYAAHMWELFAVRSWIVAFLTFSLSVQPSGQGRASAAGVAALVALLSTLASVGGAELALRYGRKRVVMCIMGSSALAACAIGFAACLPFPLTAIACIAYGMLVQGDSGALHTGTVQAAEEELRGATMAIQSLIGFAAASAGPLAVGFVLDASGGGKSVASWVLAFMTMGAGVALGPLILKFHARGSGKGRQAC